MSADLVALDTVRFASALALGAPASPGGAARAVDFSSGRAGQRLCRARAAAALPGRPRVGGPSEGHRPGVESQRRCRGAAATVVARSRPLRRRCWRRWRAGPAAVGRGWALERQGLAEQRRTGRRVLVHSRRFPLRGRAVLAEIDLYAVVARSTRRVPRAGDPTPLSRGSTSTRRRPGRPDLICDRLASTRVPADRPRTRSWARLDLDACRGPG